MVLYSGASFMHHTGCPARLSRGWQRAPPPSRTLRAAQARGGLGRTRPSLTAAAPAAWECSGRDEKTAPQPNQKTSIVAAGWRTLQRPRTAGIYTSTWRVAFTACGDLRIGGKIGVCLVFVSQGWGSVHERRHCQVLFQRHHGSFISRQTLTGCPHPQPRLPREPGSARDSERRFDIAE